MTKSKVFAEACLPDSWTVSGYMGELLASGSLNTDIFEPRRGVEPERYTV